LEALKFRAADLVTEEYVTVKVRIPFDQGEAIRLFHARGLIAREDHRASGTVIRGRIPPSLLHRFAPYLED